KLPCLIWLYKVLKTFDLSGATENAFANGNGDCEGPESGQDLQFTQEERGPHQSHQMCSATMESSFSVPETEEDPEIELVQGLFRDREYLRRMEQRTTLAASPDSRRKRRTMTDVFPDPRLGAARPAAQAVKKFGSASRTAAWTANGDLPLYLPCSLVREVESLVEPFDSTRQCTDGVHAKPLNQAAELRHDPGIDWALASMCKGERPWRRSAHPHPAASRSLADVELVSFCERQLHARMDAFYSPDEDEPAGRCHFAVQLGVVAEPADTPPRTCSAAACTCKRYQKYRAAEQVLTSMNVTKRRGAVCGGGEALCSMGQHAEAARSLQRCRRDSRARRPELEFSATESRRPSDENDDEPAEYRGATSEGLYRRMGGDFSGGRQRLAVLNSSSSGMSSADDQPGAPPQTGRVPGQPVHGRTWWSARPRADRDGSTNPVKSIHLLANSEDCDSNHLESTAAEPSDRFGHCGIPLVSGC
uniref:TPR_REGION domain-containing protein n=1 Tax=Macrostomum lignano TaxID=282301 RepID=A0A1I8JQ31_9PLAT